MVAGSVTTVIGYYTPVMIVGSVLVAAGAGLVATFKVDTSVVKRVIYQLLFGTGAGLAFQQPILQSRRCCRKTKWQLL
jgi:hypothetical protein